MNEVDSNVACYVCPHCRERLDVADERWQGWVLCPECGSPSLPPIRLRRIAPSLRDAQRDRAATTLVKVDTNGDASTQAPEWQTISRPRSTIASTTPRLIVTTALVVSAFLLLIAYLERSTPNTVVFGGLTVLLFLLLLRLPRRE